MQDETNPQNAIFKVLDAVPGQAWYTASILSILASALCQLAGKKQLALFIGQWPPTFLAVGLYHKLVRPGDEDAMGQMWRAGQQAAEAGQQAAQAGQQMAEGAREF